MTIMPGDVVMLKSGGLPLTAIAVVEDRVECLWINGSGELVRERIPAVALIVADSDSPDAFDAEDDLDDADALEAA